MALGVGIALIVHYVREKSFLLGITILLFGFAVIVTAFGVFLILFKHKNPADFYIVQSQTTLSTVNEGFASEVEESNYTIASGALTETTTC